MFSIGNGSSPEKKSAGKEKSKGLNGGERSLIPYIFNQKEKRFLREKHHVVIVDLGEGPEKGRTAGTQRGGNLIDGIVSGERTPSSSSESRICT